MTIKYLPAPQLFHLKPPGQSALHSLPVEVLMVEKEQALSAAGILLDCWLPPRELDKGPVKTHLVSGFGEAAQVLQKQFITVSLNSDFSIILQK